jgi:hypothetical protein
MFTMPGGSDNPEVSLHFTTTRAQKPKPLLLALGKPTQPHSHAPDYEERDIAEDAFQLVEPLAITPLRAKADTK